MLTYVAPLVQRLSIRSMSSSLLRRRHNKLSTAPFLSSFLLVKPSNNTLISTSFRTFGSEREPDPKQSKRTGSRAFLGKELCALTDLFYRHAKNSPSELYGGCDTSGKPYLCLAGVKSLLESIGERPDEDTLNSLFEKADQNRDGILDLEEFLRGSDLVLGDAPAQIILVVGGPGSGKGVLCKRLQEECNVVHLSCGEMLREEVSKKTPLGIEVAGIMKRGELVPSDVVTALVRRRSRSYPGRRILLDGFPRSLENAQDFTASCGHPELALHLYCDDTILLERILKRGALAKHDSADMKTTSLNGNGHDVRTDDNIETALRRMRTYHKYHRPTMEWLREHHVPVVNLDCSMTPENVWAQLLAIGRLMRPAAVGGSIF